MSNVLNAADVEALALRYGLNIRDLCASADVALATFYRWRAGKGDINLETYDRLLTAIGKAKEGTHTGG